MFLVSLVPNILVVTPSVPVKTVADIIAYAKDAPDGIDMASSGNGTLAASLPRDVPAARPASRSTTCPIAAAGWRSTT